jgi:hypothetical protein
MAITHSKVSAKSDGGDTSLVLPSDWNADHTGSLSDLTSYFKLTADISPTALSASVDDYDPTGLSTASVLRLSTNSGTQRNITGIAGGADGRILLIHNLGSGAIGLLDNTTSTAANRFAIAGGAILPADGSILLQYDSTSSRWRAVGRATAAAANTIALGTAATAGTSQYLLRSDDTILAFDATVPANSGTAAAGVASTAARRDHIHPGLATDTFWAAKGDLVVATANDAAAVLTAPVTRRTRLTADDTGTLSWGPQEASKTGLRLADDFMNNTLTTATGTSIGNLVTTLTGTGARMDYGPIANPGNHPGIISLDTGTTSLGYSALSLRSTAVIFGAGRVRFGAWVNIPVVSTSLQRFEFDCGFMDQTTGAGTVDGYFFEYMDTVNSGAWSVTTVANSVSTSTLNITTGTTMTAAQWYLLEAEVNAAGTSVTYYIDGVSTGVTHTTNMPTGVGRETGFRMQMTKSIGTTNSLAYIDAYYIENDFTTAR